MSEIGDGLDVGARFSNSAMQLSRRLFMQTAAIAGSSLAALGISLPALGESGWRDGTSTANQRPMGDNEMSSATDEMTRERIRRVLLSGPDSVTREATVADMDSQGKLTVLRPG